MVDCIGNRVEEGAAAEHERAAIILNIVKARFNRGFIIAMVGDQGHIEQRRCVNHIRQTKHFARANDTVRVKALFTNYCRVHFIERASGFHADLDA